MDLSVLDVIPVASGHSPQQALAGAGELAQRVDKLGFKRLWYAEHHGMQNIASTSPEVMIAHAGALTNRIRIGAGGVMLPNHVPLRVVEQYRTLNALYSGRIDLGIGRASGSDPLTARALRATSGGEFEELMAEVQAFEHHEFPAGHPFGHIRVTPGAISLPPIWMLGSSGGSAQFAGENGLGYAFAGHFSPTPAPPATRAYRENFKPSKEFTSPHVILALNVLCAETNAKAAEIALPVLYALTALERGETRPVLSPEEVRKKGFTGAPDSLGTMARLLIAGDPPTVRARIEKLAFEAGAHEVMVMTLAHSPQDRLRSYELLAQVFQLNQSPPA
ncbi:MAG: LLM class flavin-dependent oxidoreductase [Planctomycetes bacterium]|nr:LLM class flavin-dependent oxidoreductase [Planctomycetota bacterium]